MVDSERFKDLESSYAKADMPELVKQQGEYTIDDIRNLEHAINLLKRLTTESVVAFSKTGTKTAYNALRHAKEYLEQQVAVRTTEDQEKKKTE